MLNSELFKAIEVEPPEEPEAGDPDHEPPGARDDHQAQEEVARREVHLSSDGRLLGGRALRRDEEARQI